jgi:uncharacterized protein YkwD
MANSTIALLYFPALYVICAIPISNHFLLVQMPHPESDATYSSLYFMEGANDAADREQNPDLDELARQIVDRTNAFRKKNRLPPLSSDEQLTATASDFAKFMAETGKYGHTSDGKQPYERANLHGYEHCIVLENIAFKYNSEGIAQEELLTFFVESWKESPSHRKNMLDRDLTQTGVAVRLRGKKYYYAVQVFGRPKAAMIKFEIANQADIPLEYTLGDQSFTLKPKRAHEQEICRKIAIVATISGLRNPKSYIPESGDHFEYRKNNRGLYSFVRVNP